METTQWEDIVLDTSAFIQGEIEPLRRLAKRLWTLPQVLQEVKDNKAKQSASFALDIIPNGIKQALPSRESVNFIVDYATKSGDIQALSKTDILVLALTHEIRQRNEGTTQKSSEALLNGIKDVEEGQDLTAKEEEEGEQHEEQLKEKTGESVQPVSTTATTGTAKATSSIVQPGKSWASVLRPSASSSSNPSSPSTTTVEKQEKESEPTNVVQQHEEFEDEYEEEDDDVEQLTSSLKDSSVGDGNNGGKPKAKEGKTVMWDDDDFAVDSRSTTKQPEVAPTLDSKQDWPDLPQPKPKPASAIASAWSKPPSLTAWTGTQSSPSSHGTAPPTTTTANESSVNKEQQQQVKRHDPQTSRILSAGGLATTTASTSTASNKLDVDDADLEWAKPGSTSTGWTHVSTNKKKSNFNNKPQPQQRATTEIANGNNVPVVPECSVACSTADFACQNILLQLKLGILTLDGRRVTRVKSWVYKCDTCLRIFPIKEKRLFCSACGHPSLSRLAYSIDPNGNRRYHYSKSRRMRTQGNVYPIGKNADLLLREDQLLSGIWAQRMQRKSNATSMFGEDVNDAMGIDLRANANTIRVGFGSQNPNAMRGRERRGSKKKKKN